MQQTLTFTLNKEKYVSKPFDFEAFCLINENHLDENNKSVFVCSREAVSHMFEGTKATEDVLNKLDVSTMARLCKKTWNFYMDVLNDMGKNE